MAKTHECVVPQDDSPTTVDTPLAIAKVTVGSRKSPPREKKPTAMCALKARIMEFVTAVEDAGQDLPPGFIDQILRCSSCDVELHDVSYIFQIQGSRLLTDDAIDELGRKWREDNS